MMFIEWLNIDRKQFVQCIMSYTTYFVNFMKEKNINLFSGGSDIHYTEPPTKNGLYANLFLCKNSF